MKIQLRCANCKKRITITKDKIELVEDEDEFLCPKCEEKLKPKVKNTPRCNKFTPSKRLMLKSSHGGR